MKQSNLINLLLLFLLLGSCKGRSETTAPTQARQPVISPILPEEPEELLTPAPGKENSPTIRLFQQYGLANVRDYAPDILVELKYATIDNFTGQIAYTDFTEAWLMDAVAQRLARVQRYLTESHPGYRLLIYDAARPLSVQRKLFDSVKGTPKANYVANPRNTGLHNYGAAVDLTIVDSSGTPLDMGTEFDHLGREAHTDIEAQLLAERKITEQQINNRKLLRKVMSKEGFRVLKREWWHFNACTLSEAKHKYKLLDF